MAETDPVAAYLAEVREAVEQRDALVARMPKFVAVDPGEFNAAQDRLAARVPRLLAAVEAVLAAHRPAMDVLGRLVPDPRCQWCREADGQRSKWPCGEFLTVSRALLGEGGQ